MKTKNCFKKVAVLLLLNIILISCNSYRIGEEFEVKLERDGTGGYVWQYDSIPEVKAIDSITVIDSIQNSNPNDQLDGKLNTYTKIYTMVGKTKGRYELSFVKKRSFEPDTLNPEVHKKIKVRIKNK